MILLNKPRHARCPAMAMASADVSRTRAVVHARSVSRGFTLVELMITVAVAAVLIAIAVPSFRTITLKNRLNAAANELVDSINTARMEAVKRNNYAQFCSNASANNGTDALGAACTAAGEGASVLLLDKTSKKTFIAHAPAVKITSPLKLNSDIKAIRFDGQGLGHDVSGSGLSDGTVVDICTDQLSSDNHRLINVTTGTIVTVSKGPGACN